MRVMRERDRDEQGVVALMVALLAVVLLVIAALVVDFGQAYMNKRQAQTAADAGALAAIKVYVDAKATCPASGNGSPIVPAGGVLGDANAVAEEMRVENMGVDDEGSGALTPVVCQDGAVTARYRVETPSPVGLGQLAGSDETLVVSREAVATYGVSGNGVGSLRPWMICGAQLPTGPLPSAVIEIGMPMNGHKPPPSGHCTTDHSGDWWRTKCFNEGGAHGDTVLNVLEGCDAVETVPGQNPAWDSATLSNHLTSNCTVESEHCLEDDSGYSINKSVREAWDTLLGKTIAMPVFCDGPTDCSPTSVPKKSKWPIWKIAAVTVCGYSFKGNRTSDDLPAECDPYNTADARPSHFGSKDNGLLLVFRELIQSGGKSGFTIDVETTMRLVE